MCPGLASLKLLIDFIVYFTPTQFQIPKSDLIRKATKSGKATRHPKVLHSVSEVDDVYWVLRTYKLLSMAGTPKLTAPSLMDQTAHF